MSDLSIDELRRQAKRLGYRLEPITKRDEDKALFDNCTTREEVQQVIAGLPRGYLLDPWSVPTAVDLENRREVKEEMLRRGIEPFKPVTCG